jgi:hypothetical protein
LTRIIDPARQALVLAWWIASRIKMRRRYDQAVLTESGRLSLPQFSFMARLVVVCQETFTQIVSSLLRLVHVCRANQTSLKHFYSQNRFVYGDGTSSTSRSALQTSHQGAVGQRQHTTHRSTPAALNASVVLISRNGARQYCQIFAGRITIGDTQALRLS